MLSADGRAGRQALGNRVYKCDKDARHVEVRNSDSALRFLPLDQSNAYI